jgi:hypothetical protein
MPLPPLPESIKPQIRILDFTPQPMVDWLNPVELARTAGRVVLAGVFGSYADKREIQAALDIRAAPSNEGYGERQELWFDYIADIGDGFEATYTMAYLLAKPALDVVDGNGGGERLQRGAVLFLGGDQVYPTASRDNYRHRMCGPYSFAFPERASHHPLEGTRPQLYAIPGNHDWYDGLTSFVRTFCQGRTIGGWQTCQRRSYFAVRLPHDWWIWGIDIQLEADIDDPQLDYFRRAASEMHKASGGRRPKLVMVTAEPAWVHAGAPGARVGRIACTPESFHNLAFFVSRTIEPAGIDLRLILAGDQHHYARYAQTSCVGRDDAGTWQLVTSGGGGAYLSATHHLFPELTVTSAEDAATRTFRREATYPAPAESFWRSFGCFLLPLLSPRFALMLGVIYLLLGSQLQASWVQCVPEAGDTCTGRLQLIELLLQRPSLDEALQWQWRAAGTNPQVAIGVALVAALLFLFAQARPWPRRLWIALLHTVAHVFTIAAGLVAGATIVAPMVDRIDTAGTYLTVGWQMAMLGAVIFAWGATIGSLVFAAYLWLSAHFVTGAPHMNEVFSSQRCKDRKQFIRFHLDPRGTLTAYVVAVDRVARSGEWVPAAVPNPSLYTPNPEPVYRVIDRFEA